MELLERYRELCETMAESGDGRKMRTFAAAEAWAFEQIVNTYPAIAREWVERLEPVDWCNYLTEAEAAGIAGALAGRDGSRGPLWTLAQVEGIAAASGGKADSVPYYNRHALFVTMNMLASEHLATLAGFIPEGERARVIYKLAVDKLTDPDRPEFIRPYFDL